MQFGLAILRIQTGLDYSQIVEDEDAPAPSQQNGGPTELAELHEPTLQQQQGQLAQGKLVIVTEYYSLIFSACGLC